MRTFFHRAAITIATIFLFLTTGCQEPSQPLHGATSTAVVVRETPFIKSTPTSKLTPTHIFEGSFCAYSNGSIENIEIKSDLLTYPLAVKIYLPPCYNENRSPAYPVLYMIHGQANDFNQWQQLGLLDAADKLILVGSITPMIIVMPYDISWTVGPQDSSFDEAVIEALIPNVEENYNACSERSCRAVGGLSRGGNWAVNLGFTHPELFTAIGSHSSPLFYGDIPRITAILKTEGAIAKLPSIYIDVGNKDENLAQVLAFVDLLKKFNVPYLFTEFMGYHTDEYWSAHTTDYLLWYSSEISVVP